MIERVRVNYHCQWQRRKTTTTVSNLTFLNQGQQLYLYPYTINSKCSFSQVLTFEMSELTLNDEQTKIAFNDKIDIINSMRNIIIRQKVKSDVC